MSDCTLSWAAKRFFDKQKMKCLIVKRNIKYECKKVDVNFYSAMNIIKFDVENNEVGILKYKWIQWQLWPSTTVVPSSHCRDTEKKKNPENLPTLSDSSCRCFVSCSTVLCNSENCPQVGQVELRCGHCARYPWGPEMR